MTYDLVFDLGQSLGTPHAVSSGAMLAGKAALPLALALVVGRGMRRAGAARRHLVLAAGIAAALLLPVASALAPAWRVSVLPRVSEWAPAMSRNEVRPDDDVGSDLVAPLPNPLVAMGRSSEGATVPVPVSDGDDTPVSSPLGRQSPVYPPSTGFNDSSRRVSGISLLVALWLSGALLTLVPWGIGLLVRRGYARGATTRLPVEWEAALHALRGDETVPRRVTILATRATSMPMTWGVVRPIVLVPRDVDWSPEARRAALLHEVAHVKRGDSLTQLVARLACAMYWFNPLVWLVARAERLAREEACDDVVLRSGARASAYAEQLIGVARVSRVAPLPVAALTMARRSNLSERLRAILDATRDRSDAGGRSRRAVLVATLFVLSILGALTPVPGVAGQSANVAAALPPAGAPPPSRTFTPSVPRDETSMSGDVVVAAPAQGIPALSATSESLTAPSPESVFSTTRIVTRDSSSIAIPPAAQRSVPAQGGIARCTTARNGSKHSSNSQFSVSDDGAPERKRWDVKWNDGDCRMELTARGAFTLTPDADDIASITPGGYFDLLDELGDVERRLRITAGSGGELSRDYRVNGDRSPYDAAAAAWFAQALLALDRRTAFAVDARLPLLLQRGGVDAVIAEAAQMAGDYPQRVYFTKLLARRSVTADELGRVLAGASQSFQSDYEKAELLVAVAKQRSFNDGVHLPFARMAATVRSGYERRRALSALLTRDDLRPEVVQTVLASADGMGSDYELAELLLAVSRRYAIDAGTRPYYLRALASLGSDYEHRRVLDALVKGGDLTPTVSAFLLGDARRLQSDYELAEFLLHVAAVAQFDESALQNYLSAVETIQSDYEQHRALSALLRRKDLPPSALRPVVESARSLQSDYERASLLVEVAEGREVTGDLLEAYLQVAGTLRSEYERDRALAALPRSRASRVKL